MHPAFIAFEMMLEEALARKGEWLFPLDEIESLEDVRRIMGAQSAEEAIKKMKSFLDDYFDFHEVIPIVEISLSPPRIRILDRGSVELVLKIKELRSQAGKKFSKEFENIVANNLCKRFPGKFLNVGDPRKNRKEKPFREFLKTSAGFELSRIKKINDGGLDVLWLMPLGNSPFQPMVVFQCKNTDKADDQVKVSISDAKRTLGHHLHFTNAGQYMLLVVLNTYVTSAELEQCSKREWISLGIADLLPRKHTFQPAVHL